MSRFNPFSLLCVGVLAGPLIAQNPSVRLHPTIDSSHTEIWVTGLAPFEGFDLSLTQKRGGLDAPLLRGRRLRRRADGSGRYHTSVPINRNQLGSTSLWGQLQTSTSLGGSSFIAGGIVGTSITSPWSLFRDDPARLPTTALHLGGAYASSGDVNDDGLDDLLLTTASGVHLWLQTAQGQFVDATATRLPVIGYATPWAKLLDVDGDNRPEIYLPGGDPVAGNPDRILWNDGSGFFATSTSLPLASVQTSDVVAGDVDGDSDKDLVLAIGLANHTTAGAADRLYLNDGAGNFTSNTSFSSAAWNETVTASTSLVLADMDGDANLDLFIGKSDPGAVSGSFGGKNVLLLGDGNGGFVEVSTSQLLPAHRKDQTYALACVDLEGDGDMDLVAANALTSVPGALSADVLINQGGAQAGTEGIFVDAVGALPETPPIYESIRLSLTVADLNLDGLVDVSFGVHDLPPGMGGQPVFMNTPAGSPAFERLDSFQPGTFICRSLTTLDVDGDGDLDLFMLADGSVAGGTDATRARLYINQTF
ncbi:MAG: VCBS repeat-containing protein [Planctomycetota bacterium]|nr:VCBS repeat-containing protein [Planctomycetota bacterium]